MAFRTTKKPIPFLLFKINSTKNIYFLKKQGVRVRLLGQPVHLPARPLRLRRGTGRLGRRRVDSEAHGDPHTAAGRGADKVSLLLFKKAAKFTGHSAVRRCCCCLITTLRSYDPRCKKKCFLIIFFRLGSFFVYFDFFLGNIVAYQWQLGSLASLGNKHQRTENLNEDQNFLV